MQFVKEVISRPEVMKINQGAHNCNWDLTGNKDGEGNLAGQADKDHKRNQAEETYKDHKRNQAEEIDKDHKRNQAEETDKDHKRNQAGEIDKDEAKCLQKKIYDKSSNRDAPTKINSEETIQGKAKMLSHLSSKASASGAAHQEQAAQTARKDKKLIRSARMADVTDSLGSARMADVTDSLRSARMADITDSLGSAKMADVTDSLGSAITADVTDSLGSARMADVTDSLGSARMADVTDSLGSARMADVTDSLGSAITADVTDSLESARMADVTDSLGSARLGKREASLNASIKVNIFYERQTSGKFAKKPVRSAMNVGPDVGRNEKTCVVENGLVKHGKETSTEAMKEIRGSDAHKKVREKPNRKRAASQSDCSSSSSRKRRSPTYKIFKETPATQKCIEYDGNSRNNKTKRRKKSMSPDDHLCNIIEKRPRQASLVAKAMIAMETEEDVVCDAAARTKVYQWLSWKQQKQCDFRKITWFIGLGGNKKRVQSAADDDEAEDEQDPPTAPTQNECSHGLVLRILHETGDCRLLREYLRAQREDFFGPLDVESCTTPQKLVSPPSASHRNLSLADDDTTDDIIDKPSTGSPQPDQLGSSVSLSYSATHTNSHGNRVAPQAKKVVPHTDRQDKEVAPKAKNVAPHTDPQAEEVVHHIDPEDKKVAPQAKKVAHHIDPEDKKVAPHTDRQAKKVVRYINPEDKKVAPQAKKVFRHIDPEDKKVAPQAKNVVSETDPEDKKVAPQAKKVVRHIDPEDKKVAPHTTSADTQNIMNRAQPEGYSLPDPAPPHPGAGDTDIRYEDSSLTFMFGHTSFNLPTVNSHKTATFSSHPSVQHLGFNYGPCFPATIPANLKHVTSTAATLPVNRQQNLSTIACLTSQPQQNLSTIACLTSQPQQNLSTIACLPVNRQQNLSTIACLPSQPQQNLSTIACLPSQPQQNLSTIACLPSQPQHTPSIAPSHWQQPHPSSHISVVGQHLISQDRDQRRQYHPQHPSFPHNDSHRSMPPHPSFPHNNDSHRSLPPQACAPAARLPTVEHLAATPTQVGPPPVRHPLLILPHVGCSHTGSPHMGSPHMGPPHMGPPHMGPPHMGSPHMGPPHMGPPHMRTASSLTCSLKMLHQTTISSETVDFPPNCKCYHDHLNNHIPHTLVSPCHSAQDSHSSGHQPSASCHETTCFTSNTEDMPGQPHLVHNSLSCLSQPSASCRETTCFSSNTANLEDLSETGMDFAGQTFMHDDQCPARSCRADHESSDVSDLLHSAHAAMFQNEGSGPFENFKGLNQTIVSSSMRDCPTKIVMGHACPTKIVMGCACPTKIVMGCASPNRTNVTGHALFPTSLPVPMVKHVPGCKVESETGHEICTKSGQAAMFGQIEYRKVEQPPSTLVCFNAAQLNDTSNPGNTNIMTQESDASNRGNHSQIIESRVAETKPNDIIVIKDSDESSDDEPLSRLIKDKSPHDNCHMSKSDIKDPEKNVDVRDPEKNVDVRDSEKNVDVKDPEKSVDAGDPEKNVDAGDPEKNVDAGDPEKSVDVLKNELQPRSKIKTKQKNKQNQASVGQTRSKGIMRLEKLTSHKLPDTRNRKHVKPLSGSANKDNSVQLQNSAGAGKCQGQLDKENRSKTSTKKIKKCVTIQPEQIVAKTKVKKCMTTQAATNKIFVISQAQQTVVKTNISHGWTWMGHGQLKPVPKLTCSREEEVRLRKCYWSMRHSSGETICVGDCVILQSDGDSSVPFVAKVSALWENLNGEMMFSMLWYYQPEHTNAGREPDDGEQEVFASKHREENSVACIDDKCYVVLYNEYCRLEAELARQEQGAPLPSWRSLMPVVSEDDKKLCRPLPPANACLDNIWFCRYDYDVRKKIVKKPRNRKFNLRYRAAR